LATGEILRELDLGSEIPDIVAYSPDGKTLVAASGSMVRVWDAAAWQLKRTLGGHRGKIEAIAFNRDGKRLATASADTTVLIWDMSK
jgi:WD40 repeat protein